MSLSSKASNQIKLDEKTYEIVWNTHSHNCQECGVYLGESFRVNGRVCNKSFFSHILPKGAYPEYRNNPYNFNLLCPTCHHTWEFGNRSGMSIYERNLETIELLKSGSINTEISRILYEIKNTLKNGRISLSKLKFLGSKIEASEMSEMEARISSSVVEVTEFVDRLISKYKNRDLYA